MRKTSKILVVLCLLLVLTGAIALTGCANTGKMSSKMYEGYTDLAKSATFTDNGKNMRSFSIKGKENEKKGITIDLGKETEFNTIELNEKTAGVTMFSIFASNDPDLSTFKLIYEGDTIETFRICFVGNVSYRYLRIDVVDSSTDYNVNDIKIYKNINENATKRVASYFLIDRIDSTDLNALDTVTDIILFSWMRFDKDGSIKLFVDNADWTGFLPEAEAEAKYKTNLDKLKTAVRDVETKQNRKINIFPTILMPWSDDPNDANKYARAIMENADATAQNVKAFIDKWGFDGVDFDYEYPYSGKEHKLFDNFLIAVRKAIGEDKILSTALGAWNIDIAPEAIAVLDQVQLMTYDIFDSHGYHAAFHSCMIRDLTVAMDKGIPAEKINLGLPFYSRPICKAGYWGDYFKFLEDGEFKVLDSKSPTSKYKNLVSFSTRDSANYPINEPEYFNGYQMIQDKMAFAIDSKVAGVMMWHMNCDIEYSRELSLLRAIHETILAKSAHLVTNK